MPARARSVAAVLSLLVAASVLLSASGPLAESAAAIQLQLADLLFGQADYRGALGVYQRVVGSADLQLSTRARFGTVRSALRIAEFRVAEAHAETLRSLAPEDPDTLTLWGDSLWASGRFEEAEAAYADALGRAPALARAQRGLARSLASRNQLPAALEHAEAAVRAAPGDPEIHHTLGAVLERLRRYDAAAAEYSTYLGLLAPGDRPETAAFVRSHINLLRSFKGQIPFEIVAPPGVRQHTVPFRLVNDKVVVRVRLNGDEDVDMALDTGAEQTVVSARTARKLTLPVMGLTLSAGVGMVGMRGMQISKIDSIELGSLKVRHVTCLIKNPALEGMPYGEPDCLSPLALGLSVTVDYKARRVTLGEPRPGGPSEYELPLRMTRLATVQGVVDGQPASFIVDTGGQVISLNTETARSLFKPVDRRRIALRVYGSSGFDPEAYLLPGVSLAFDRMRLPTQPVVVLNLRAPSILLGYHIGGIIGHKLLSKYRVEFDMQRSVLRLHRM
jgi:Flp pilus assembly protein TadD